MPAGPVSDPRAGYTVGAVAERLGVPTATLRSWTQRYGIGPSGHQPGRHRLYTETDIAALERMLELVRAGVSPAGAAGAARGPQAAFGDSARLLSAAFALDSDAVTGLLTAHLRAHGVVATWDELCRPAFAEIVAEQERGTGCIDVEHLLSWCIAATLQQGYPSPAARATALLACTSGETHSLPLEVLRSALAERGVAVLMLGANVPTAALRDALGRTPAPAMVVLWSQQESTALVSAVRACTDAGARVLVGGPGWSTALLPDDVRPLPSLTDAVTELLRVGPR
ncbi:MerR family transcriptional regulator [Nocardia sp. alder85J]|uniref:MerR family transcriptional regulator n=1 Tax=Nocardia sp. alder85J TaxID=2862949 RepID=UPI001CD1E68F|nr:MerR family transcriptional regulator [Nocardia sp. alder85J]MCX4098166.1 MerR family transcriptional regulator [Nocardia sp. alder85J]